MDVYKKLAVVAGSKPTVEGAGVHLKRVFGFYEAPGLDPFLLLDDFGSDDPDDYLAGFPWHPHRGIETVTYMLAGEVEHGDSLGNTGVIRSGDVQWMTAGSGIIHQEMPRIFKGRSRGFQLWVNLPAASKMMAPRYREVLATEIPMVTPAAGVGIRVVSGTAGGVSGPVRDLVVETEYLDITLESHGVLEHEIRPGNRVFAYVITGQGFFGPDRKEAVGAENLAVFGDGGTRLRLSAGESGCRLLLVSGRPLGEPVAWRGPIVMNTQAELAVAFDEYQQGTFIK